MHHRPIPKSVSLTLILAALILGVTVTLAYDNADGLKEGALTAVFLSIRELIGHAYGHWRGEKSEGTQPAPSGGPP